jgi:hypothetical protein
MAVDKALFEARKKRIAAEVRDTPSIIAKLYARKDFSRVGHNVNLIARAILLRGMMNHRVAGDIASAVADFRAASALTKDFDPAVEGIDKSGPQSGNAHLHAEDLGIPLYACLLASDWERAKTVARFVSHPAVLAREDPVHGKMTALLAALVLDDRERFRALKAEYDGMKKSRWWQYFIHYVDLYASVIERGQPRFEALMEEADKKFRARAKDRTFGDLRPEFGGLAENEMVLDFMALGIAKLAVRRGMRLARDTDLVPRALIDS